MHPHGNNDWSDADQSVANNLNRPVGVVPDEHLINQWYSNPIIQRICVGQPRADLTFVVPETLGV